jgi:hypothetical protein
MWYLHTDDEVLDFDRVEALHEYLKETRTTYPNDIVGPEYFPEYYDEDGTPHGYNVLAEIRDEVDLRGWILEEKRGRGRPKLKIRKRTITTTLSMKLYGEVLMYAFRKDIPINQVFEVALTDWLAKQDS